jgi:Putative redox-active protein (C_GCAxxG_C_C)
MEKEAKDCCSQSRRKMVIGTAGALAAGAALTQFGGLLNSAQAKGGKTEKWPWPYEKLDPAKTAEICYEEWYRVFCGCAVINSVFSQLKEKVGEPYASFPSDAFVFLEGGMVGWGTVCGSPAGANITANLILGPRIAGSPVAHQISDDLMEWYGDVDMPVFKPAKPRIAIDKIITTSSDSPLCHVSVGKWMEASGHPLKSAERKDRCARVAASTAYRLVELLNDWKDGKYEPSGTFSAVKEHGITGQMNCGECHEDVPSPPQPSLKS